MDEAGREDAERADKCRLVIRARQQNWEDKNPSYRWALGTPHGKEQEGKEAGLLQGGRKPCIGQEGGLFVPIHLPKQLESHRPDRQHTSNQPGPEQPGSPRHLDHWL